MVFSNLVILTTTININDLNMPRIVKVILKKKKKVGRLTLPDFNIYLKSFSNQNNAILV